MSRAERFTGRRIAVIGAASGTIGGAIVQRLVDEGATVVIGGRSRERMASAAAGLAGPGRVTGAVPVDLGDADSIAGFVDAAATAMGGLDGLVNNAALYGAADEDGDLLETGVESLDRLLAVNLRGHLLVARAAVPHLLQAGGGSIVLTSSLAGVIGEPTRVAYGIAKAGIISLARHVAARWGKQGVRANVVVPGRIVAAPAATALDEALREQFLRSVASPRLGAPHDIAAATAFLLSDDAAFVNATTLTVDGGASAIFAPAPADDADFYSRYPFSRSAIGVDELE